MPNIVVCYKWVIDEADVRVESGGSLNLERAARKSSEYDRNAIEAAAQLHEQHGGEEEPQYQGEVQPPLHDAPPPLNCGLASARSVTASPSITTNQAQKISPMEATTWGWL